MTASVTLAWAEANGPVAGYSVYVQRDGGGAFKHELDVSASKVTLHGEPGSTARVSVIAFDTRRVFGPSSPSSPLFTFPGGSSTNQTQSAGFGSSEVPTGGSGASDPTSDPAPTPPADPKDEPPALPGTLVWQSGDGFRLTDSALVTTQLFARPADNAQLAAVADFDADGQGDLLWVGANAQLAYTPGSALRGGDTTALVEFGALGADEHVIGAGDFDGDGDGDVLVASGDAVRARLTAPGGAATTNELGTATQAVFAGVADFDGNGSDDIAWRASTGSLVVWLMDGGNLSASVEVALPGGLVTIGVGDFDGNGQAEVALRSQNGTVYLVHPLVASPQLQSTDLTNAAIWTPVGHADLDSDGSDELVLATAGAIRIASLPGGQILAQEPESPWTLVALLP
jgi:hypothetical protein